MFVVAVSDREGVVRFALGPCDDEHAGRVSDALRLPDGWGRTVVPLRAPGDVVDAQEQVRKRGGG